MKTQTQTQTKTMYRYTLSVVVVTDAPMSEVAEALDNLPAPRGATVCTSVWTLDHARDLLDGLTGAHLLSA